MPVTAEQVQVATRRDPVLSQVFRCVQDGWPATVNDKYKPFHKHLKMNGLLKLVAYCGVTM